MFVIKKMKLSELEVNKGQLQDIGLPKNPRFIRDEKFERLKKSLEDAPEMMELREVIAYDPNNGEKPVIICGNMRYRAAKEIGIKEVLVKLLSHDTPAEKLREYTIKDNVSFGQDDWDLIANEWDNEELTEWGVDVWNFNPEDTSFGTSHNNNSPSMPPKSPQSEGVPTTNLPEEIANIDLTPTALPKIQGSDECAVERIIITYPKDREIDVCSLIGLGKIEKVVYSIEELMAND